MPKPNTLWGDDGLGWVALLVGFGAASLGYAEGFVEMLKFLIGMGVFSAGAFVVWAFIHEIAAQLPENVARRSEHQAQTLNDLARKLREERSRMGERGNPWK